MSKDVGEKIAFAIDELRDEAERLLERAKSIDEAWSKKDYYFLASIGVITEYDWREMCGEN